MLTLREVCEGMRGQVCTDVAADPEHHLMLEFGGLAAVQLPPGLPEPGHTVRGEVSILITCGWLIHESGAALEGWDSADALNGLTVVDMRFTNRNLDFFLTLSGDRVLDVYTDQSRFRSYQFRFGDTYWAVGAGGQVTE